MSKIFYTADLHFGHSNIIKLCKRPFDSVDEMNKVLIQKWNDKVDQDDTVFILGDFAFKSSENPGNLISKLKGHKFLIQGNHDGQTLKRPEFRKQFEDIFRMLTVNDSGYMLILNHYPMVEWDGYFRGSLHVYGHIHNNVTNRAYKIMYSEPNAFNAGVDICDFAPVTLSELKEYNQRFKEANPIKY